MAKIIGNTTATPNPRPDWNQTDETKADYIKNKPKLEELLEEAKAYTDREIAEFDFIKIVNELPETGLPNKIYLVPKTDAQEKDLFDEYLWILVDPNTNTYQWEWISTKSIDVDFTNYYNKDEIDAKISSVYKFMGTAYTSSLKMSPNYTSENPGLESQFISGNVYNIANDGIISVGLTDKSLISNEKSLRFIVIISNDEGVQFGEIEYDNGRLIGEDILGTTTQFYYKTSEKELLVSLVANKDLGPAWRVSEILDCKTNEKVDKLDGDGFYYDIKQLSLPNVTVKQGDNVAWTSWGWDRLSGIIDLTNYYTKEETDSKLTSIYKFMGSVDISEITMSEDEISFGYAFDSLLEKCINGYVYNLRESGNLNSKFMARNLIDRTQMLQFSWNNYLEFGSWGNFVINNRVVYPPWKEATFYWSNPDDQLLITVENKGTVNQPNWQVVKIEETTYQNLEGTGVYRDSLPRLSEANEDGTYTDFYNVYLIKLPDLYVNEGDNVAWTDWGWDVLSGTIDLTNYVTNEQLEGLIDDILTEAKQSGEFKGEKGDTPAISFRYDEETGNLYYSSDGILIDKEYVDSNNLVTKEVLDNTLGDIESALDDIITIQNEFMGVNE